MMPPYACIRCGLISRSKDCPRCAESVKTLNEQVNSLVAIMMRQQYTKNVRAKRDRKRRAARKTTVTGPAPTAESLSTTIRIRRAPLEGL